MAGHSCESASTPAAIASAVEYAAVRGTPALSLGAHKGDFGAQQGVVAQRLRAPYEPSHKSRSALPAPPLRARDGRPGHPIPPSASSMLAAAGAEDSSSMWE